MNMSDMKQNYMMSFTKIRWYVLVLCLLHTSLFGMQKSAIQCEISPSTIEFAYDMHETLVVRNMKATLTLSWDHSVPRKFITLVALLTHDYIRYMFDGRIRPAHKLALNLYSLIANKTGTSFEIWKPMVEEYDSSLGTFATKMAQAYDAMPGIKELVQELKELGYTQRIATNGGPTDYQLLAAKHSPIFGCFQEGLTVSADEPHVRKPHSEYFYRYHQRFNTLRTKTIIFIDDKQKNIDAANEAGMYGILFTSAQQLRKDLKELGFLLR